MVKYILKKTGEYALFGGLALGLGYTGYQLPQYGQTGKRAAVLEKQPGPAMYKAGESIDSFLKFSDKMPMMGDKDDIAKKKRWLKMGKKYFGKTMDKAMLYSQFIPQKWRNRIQSIDKTLKYVEEQKALVEEYKPVHARLSKQRKYGAAGGVGLAFVLMVGGGAGINFLRRRKDNSDN